MDFNVARQMAINIVVSPKWAGEEKTVGEILEKWSATQIENTYNELNVNDYEVTFTFSYWVAAENVEEAKEKAAQKAMSDIDVSASFLKSYCEVSPLAYNGCDWEIRKGLTREQLNDIFEENEEYLTDEFAERILAIKTQEDFDKFTEWLQRKQFSTNLDYTLYNAAFVQLFGHEAFDQDGNPIED